MELRLSLRAKMGITYIENEVPTRVFGHEKDEVR
jgi:hypothetical protein